LHHPAART